MAFEPRDNTDPYSATLVRARARKRATGSALSPFQCASTFNMAYRLVVDDRRQVMAKIPHPSAEPPRLTTASEVATMAFARPILDLPVPKVLASSLASGHACRQHLREQPGWDLERQRLAECLDRSSVD